MGISVSAFIEVKNDKGNWELVGGGKPVSASVKYLIDDYHECPRLEWDDLSEGLQGVFKKDEDGRVYTTFYTTTLKELEEYTDKKVREVYTHINTIVKALGCARMYSDEGEEIDNWDTDEKEKMTFPVNKQLIEDFQWALADNRRIGQREAFDLFIADNTEWGKEYRIVFAAS